MGIKPSEGDIFQEQSTWLVNLPLQMGGDLRRRWRKCPFYEWKWKSLSRVRLFRTPWTVESTEFSRPEYWSRSPFLSPGDLPNPGTEPRYPTLLADSLPAEPQRKPKNTGVGSLSFLQQIFLTQESNRSLLHCREALIAVSKAIREALTAKSKTT